MHAETEHAMHTMRLLQSASKPDWLGGASLSGFIISMVIFVILAAVCITGCVCAKMSPAVAVHPHASGTAKEETAKEGTGGASGEGVSTSD